LAKYHVTVIPSYSGCSDGEKSPLQASPGKNVHEASYQQKKTAHVGALVIRAMVVSISRGIAVQAIKSETFSPK
jgi:hypothetical protein